MAQLIKSLYIDAYRGIEELKLGNFGDINILTGNNNSGKTSVLELIKGLLMPFQLNTWLRIGRRNNYSTYNRPSLFEEVLELFPVDKDNMEIKYSYIDENNKQTVIKLKANLDIISLSKGEIDAIDSLGFHKYFEAEDPDDSIADGIKKLVVEFYKDGEIINTECIYDFQRKYSMFLDKDKITREIIYISPEQHLTGNIFLSNVFDNPRLYQRMLEALKIFDEDILSINVDNDNNSVNGVIKLLSKKHNTALPLNMYGDGMKKVLLLMSALVACKDGILLLDEFETAIHTSAMLEIFTWIIDVAKENNVQIFLTSHSDETIEKLITSTENTDAKVRLFTLYKEQGMNKVRNLEAKQALLFKKEMGLELR